MIEKFEIGDKIVCIKNNYIRLPNNKFVLAPDAPINYYITPGKPYEIVSHIYRFSRSVKCIINDKGQYVTPDWYYFISNNEYRKQKLVRINESNL